MYVDLKVVVHVEQKENETALDTSIRAKNAVAKVLNETGVRRALLAVHDVSFEEIEVIE